MSSEYLVSMRVFVLEFQSLFLLLFCLMLVILLEFIGYLRDAIIIGSKEVVDPAVMNLSILAVIILFYVICSKTDVSIAFAFY